MRQAQGITLKRHMNPVRWGLLCDHIIEKFAHGNFKALTQDHTTSKKTKSVCQPRWPGSWLCAQSRNLDPRLSHHTAPLLPSMAGVWGAIREHPPHPRHLSRTTLSSSPSAFTKTPPDGFLARRESGEQDSDPAHRIHSSLRKTNRETESHKTVWCVLKQGQTQDAQRQ